MDESLVRISLAAQTKDAVRQFMIDICTATTPEGVPALLRVVADGAFKNRTCMIREFKADGLLIDESIANMVFAFFERKVLEKYGAAAPGADAKTIASTILDGLHVDTGLPADQAETLIENGWEFTDGSSESARRQFQSSDEANRLFAPHNVIHLDSDKFDVDTKPTDRKPGVIVTDADAEKP